MLCRQELEEVAKLAEDSGFRVNIVSTQYALFLLEYLPDYDIFVTYSTFEGEAQYTTTIEKKCDMTPKELKSLCDAIGLTLGLIQHMGGITFD